MAWMWIAWKISKRVSCGHQDLALEAEIRLNDVGYAADQHCREENQKDSLADLLT